MPTSYPNGLDNYIDPGATDSLQGHAGLHKNLNDAIEAIEAELGINPSGSIVDTVRARLDGIDDLVDTMNTELGSDPSGSAATVKERLDNLDITIVTIQKTLIRRETTTTTLAATDAYNAVHFDTPGDVLCVVPAGVFEYGNTIEIVQEGTGVVTLSAGSGVEIRSHNSLVKTGGVNAQVTLRRSDLEGPPEVFFAAGDLA